MKHLQPILMSKYHYAQSGPSNTKTIITYGGPSFLTLLGLLFIALKLLGTITWPWWIVLLPIYVWFALGLVAVVLAVSLQAIVLWWRRRRIKRLTCRTLKQIGDK